MAPLGGSVLPGPQEATCSLELGGQWGSSRRCQSGLRYEVATNSLLFPILMSSEVVDMRVGGGELLNLPPDRSISCQNGYIKQID